MYITFFDIFYIAIALIYLCSIGYLVIAIVAVELFNFRRKPVVDKLGEFKPPAVTILKPIYGLDPEMTENLCSFCQQDYPEYQIIFGLQDKNDPAISVVEKIIKKFSHIDVRYIIDTRLYGNNHKVSNLINMLPMAKHDYLVIADSDMRVPSNYLSNIIAPFVDEKIGAVTCLYAGSPRGKLVSTLNAMFINEWFFPSVLISKLLRPIQYCLGATMVVRRTLLDKIGGFKSFANHLADDYMLGKYISEQGYKVYLSDFVVENIVEEKSITTLITHELRWARTLRRVEPLGFAFTFLTDTLVISFMASITIYLSSAQILWSVLPLFLVLSMRLFLHERIRRIVAVKHAGSFWLIPLRDVLSFFIRIMSFTGNTVKWRNNPFCVDTAGRIHSKKTLQTKPDNGVKNISDLATTQDY